MGDFFHSGIGSIKQDLQRAFHFYEKAANLNNLDALINIGLDNIRYIISNDYL